MTGLVEDLLLLARLDAGRPLERAEVDLTRLALDAVGDARVVGPDHRWQLDLPDEPVAVTGDEPRLHQVLTNLLANARRHTPPGTTVTVGRLPHRRPTSLLTVADDGPGSPRTCVGARLRAVRPRRLLAHPRLRQHRPRPVDRRTPSWPPTAARLRGLPPRRHDVHGVAAGGQAAAWRGPDCHDPAPPAGGRATDARHGRRIGRSRERASGFPEACRHGQNREPADRARDRVAHPGRPVAPMPVAAEPRTTVSPHNGESPARERTGMSTQTTAPPSRPPPGSPRRGPARAGPGRPVGAPGAPRLLRPPPSSTCGAWARPGGPTRSTRPPRRPARRAGRRCSSALRRRQRDHRRQDAGVAVGDGPVGADLRAEQLEHPRPAGADGRRVRRAAVRDRHARRTGRRRGPDRRGGARAHPGRGADVPLQQPRRAAGAAARRRGVRDRAARPSTSRRSTRCAGSCWPARWSASRFLDQDAAGLPGAAGVRGRSTCSPRRRRLAAAAPPPAGRGRRDAGRRRLVGRGRRALARVEPGPTSAARRTTASWS